MGLAPQNGQVLINSLGEAWRSGQRFEPETPYEGFVEAFPLMFLPVLPRYYRSYLGYACWLYGGSDFPVWQCVWLDRKKLFPWEPGYHAEFFQCQRVLCQVGSWEEGWPFGEPPHAVTVAMRQLIQEDQPILQACHDDHSEACGQFLTGKPVQTADLMLLGLEEVVRRDPSILELADLPMGWQASRSSPDAPWQRAQLG